MPVATLAPDKFRGTLSASDAADAMARGVRTAGFDDVRVVPLADGGEGTLDALLAAVGGSRRTARVTGPLGGRVDAEWALLSDGTAVVEAAQASGPSRAGRATTRCATTRGRERIASTAERRDESWWVWAERRTDGGLGARRCSAGRSSALTWSPATSPPTSSTPRYGLQKGASDAEARSRPLRLLSIVTHRRRRAPKQRRAGGLAGGLCCDRRLLSPVDVAPRGGRRRRRRRPRAHR
jgi:glycerate kinase